MIGENSYMLVTITNSMRTGLPLIDTLTSLMIYHKNSSFLNCKEFSIIAVMGLGILAKKIYDYKNFQNDLLFYIFKLFGKQPCQYFKIVANADAETLPSVQQIKKQFLEMIR